MREGAPLDAEIFRRRRERFLEGIGGGVAILCAAPQLLKSRDTEVRYRQDSDFYYLTGFPEPGAVAVLSAADEARRFTLFVRPRDPEREAWNGPRAGVEGAQLRFGADAAHPVDELDTHLRDLLQPADALWYALGSDRGMDARIVELLKGFRATRPRSGSGPWDVRDPAAVLDLMRLVKEPSEIDLLRRAARITADGHRAGMRAARPGVGEWEIEAAVEGAFRAAGATGPAFPSIVGSGPNATTLHHVTNDRRVQPGELVLVDAGAEVDMYCGDITRTFPVSGRFAPAQRAVYDVVLAAEEAAIGAVRSGAAFAGVHEVAVRILTAGMVDLGLLSGGVDELVETGAYRRFYLHQTSHWLGLDVHDAGAYRTADGASVELVPGMVLTVEPGIYIPADAEGVPAELRGVGIRIEDDVLVADSGAEVLTGGVPVSPAEVEALVGAG